MTIEIMELTKPDDRTLQRIGRLRVEAWATELPAARTMQIWVDDWDRDAHHWIALDKGKVVASARMTIHDSMLDVPHQHDFINETLLRLPTPIGSINRLVVHPNYRRLRLATRLDALRIERARALKCPSLLATPIGIRRVHSLEKLGFRKIATAYGLLSFGLLSPPVQFPPVHVLRLTANAASPGSHDISCHQAPARFQALGVSQGHNRIHG